MDFGSVEHDRALVALHAADADGGLYVIGEGRTRQIGAHVMLQQHPTATCVSIAPLIVLMP